MFSTTSLSLIISQIETSNTHLQQLVSALQILNTTLQQRSFFDSPLFSAVIGGVITVLPIFLYQLYIDRPRIKVGISPSFLVDSGNLLPTFSISISNFGRRPINVTNVCLEFSNKERLFLIMATQYFVIGEYGLPKKIEENMSHSMVVSMGRMGAHLRARGDYPVRVIFIDAIGREYKCRIHKKFFDSLLNVT